MNLLIYINFIEIEKYFNLFGKTKAKKMIEYFEIIQYLKILRSIIIIFIINRFILMMRYWKLRKFDFYKLKLRFQSISMHNCYNCDYCC